MTDDTPAQPKPEHKRRKGYHLCTFISDEAGDLLNQIVERKGIKRTTWLELIIREQARKEGITK